MSVDWNNYSTKNIPCWQKIRYHLWINFLLSWYEHKRQLVNTFQHPVEKSKNFRVTKNKTWTCERPRKSIENTIYVTRMSNSSVIVNTGVTSVNLIQSMLTLLWKYPRLQIIRRITNINWPLNEQKDRTKRDHDKLVV